MIQKTSSMIRSAEVWSKGEGANHLSCSSQLTAVLDNITRRQLIERVSCELGPVLHVSPCGESRSVAMLGIPVLADGDLNAILILDLTCATNTPAAIEVWSRNERDELGLNGALFSALNRFANISKYVRFPRGSGLPGKCWEDRQVKLVNGLGNSSSFMRSTSARAGKLDLGIAVPVMRSEHDLHSVLVLLSSSDIPIAREFEIWDVDPKEGKLIRSESTGALQPAEVNDSKLEYRPGQGIAGKVWEGGLPIVSEDLESLEPQRKAAFQSAGVKRTIAFPVFVGQSVRSVIVIFD